MPVNDDALANGLLSVELQVSSLEGHLYELVAGVERVEALLEQISGGLFYLNLPVGADVAPWVSKR